MAFLALYELFDLCRFEKVLLKERLMKAKMTTKQLVQIAMIAAIYAVLTAIFSSTSSTYPFQQLS